MRGDIPNCHSGDAGIDDFWAIIGTNDLTSAKSVAAALGKVKTRLAATSPAQLSEFDQWLSRQIRELDRRAFFESPVITDDGRIFQQTDDHFLYSRCACILAGRTAMADVLAGRRSFTDFTVIRLQRAELLLYLAAQVSEEAFGTQIARPALDDNVQ
jgi:hypothetical protein